MIHGGKFKMADSKRRNGNSNKHNRTNSSTQKTRTNRVETQQDKTDKKVVQSQMYEAIKYDASNIYFSNVVGTNIIRREGLAYGTLPGILTFRSVPNFTSNSDMLNVAATSIYTYVRHANAGRTNYESSDLMVYLIAMSEIYVAIAELTRAYGIASYFTPQNRYSGLILQALGFKPIETRNQLANMRYALNVLINKVKAFAVPKAFNYFDERVSEHLNVYSDEPSNRGQFIAIVPLHYGKFNATAEGGSSIDFNSVPTQRDVLEWINTVDSWVDDLRANEDINIMSGDILKAYGDNLYMPQPIPVDLVTTPVYDELTLLQFQNGHFPYEIYTGSLTQSGNKLSQTIYIIDEPFKDSYTDKRYLNSPYEDIDPNTIFALSKYQMVFKDREGQPGTMDLVSGNTTILGRMTLHVMNSLGTDLNSTRLRQFIADDTNLHYLFRDSQYLTKFKYHPYIYLVEHSLPIGDMHYVALLSESDTNRMNDARFILAFQTMQMG